MQIAPRVPKHSFLPYLFYCERKDRAAGGIRQSQICDDLSVSSPGRGAFYSRMQIMPPVFSLIMRPRVLVSFCRASSGMRMILAVTPSETSS